MLYCGIDVHKSYIRICIVDEDGDVVETAKIKTRKPAVDRWFAGRPEMRVVLESGADASWIAKALQAHGHEAIVAHARRIQLIAENHRKTDRVDAEILARLGRSDLELLTQSYVRGEEAERLRTLLKARRHLVECRTKLANAIRGLIQKTGHRLPPGGPETLPGKLGTAELPEPLKRALAPMGFSIYVLSGWIDKMDDQLEEAAQDHEQLVETFCEICGVGIQTALAYIATIEDPTRFDRSKQVGSYFGLAPSVSNSGNENSDANNTGSITKQGDGLVRSLLVQAAHTMLWSNQRDSELRRFGKRIEAKKGKQKAVVALARKLSVVMHTLWVTGRDYDPFYYENHHASDPESS